MVEGRIELRTGDHLAPRAAVAPSRSWQFVRFPGALSQLAPFANATRDSLRLSFLRAEFDRTRPKIHLIEIDLIEVPDGVQRCCPMRTGR